MTKRWAVIILVVTIFLLGTAGYFIWQGRQRSIIISPLGNVLPPRPLLKYTFANLRQRKFEPSMITYDTLYGVQNPKFSTWTFHYFSDGKKVSGLANLPLADASFAGAQDKQGKPISTQSAMTVPIVVLLHGSIDAPEQFFPGFGTQHVAAVLAENGIATFAPDYLGYGSSASASADPFEDRFQTYTVTLTLLSTLESQCKLKIENCKLGLWGHSNGGQIALSVLEISGKSYPTVLWNPVSKPFPYSILYYTDGYDDQGKWLRSALAKFESLYDVRQFSATDYFSWIKAPVLLQQGGADDLVPKRWSDELNTALKKLDKDITYLVYPGADHNLVPSWNRAVAAATRFYLSKGIYSY